MSKVNYFAVDLGATSGRTILFTIEDGKISQREVTRFKNNIIQNCGHFNWDIYALYYEIIQGLKVIAKEGIEIKSIGIDTWGVDFVFIGKDGEVLRNPYCYRDPFTVGAPDELFKEIPAEKVYELTGIQVMNFNSLYQLYALHKEHNSALENAAKILFVPDALSYMLTGEAVCEYTIASTSNMLNPRTKRLAPELLAACGVKEEQFGRYVYPGDLVGPLSPEVQKMTGLGPVPVIAVAGHDTGSAVAAVPARDEKFAYLSSGTWSLMGIEVKDAIINQRSQKENFTNEGGIEGTTRFLKNICGMWLLERSRAEWKENGETVMGYREMEAAAGASPAFVSIINPDSPCFANPVSMLGAIKTYCQKTGQPVPETQPEVARCIFQSLALRYHEVFQLLQEFAPFEIKRLHIIGGGSQNNVVDQFTCNAVGVPVLAGPIECTSLGNVMIQAKADGLVKDINDMRNMIAGSIETKSFEPKDKEEWDKGYEKYKKICVNTI